MKTGPASAALAILLLAPSVNAAEPKNTDARSDGLFGPIRGVSTSQETQQLDWKQKDAKAWVLEISCWECEYDREGNRIKSGQILDGEFRGPVTRIVRDETGRVIERIEENYKGEVVRRDVLGPHGITEQVSYENGIPNSDATWSYDASGHVTQFFRYDQVGAVIESSFSTVDPGGNNKEQWDYGHNQAFLLHFVQTYDPKTALWTFTNFNEDGSVKVAITTEGSKLLSYWRQQTGEDHVFGSNFVMDPEGKAQDSYSCNLDGTCDRITAYFSDEKRHLVSRMEWHDPSGTLRLSFDYDYQLDQFGNWTKRTVWVWNPELGERKLCETDYRTLTYWSN
jgi:hypothetical protein